MKTNVVDDKTTEEYSKSTDMKYINENLKVDTVCEKDDNVTDNTSKMFNLKDSWSKKTIKLSEQMDGKSLSEVLNILRETFEEFREEAKGQLPSDAAGVGNGALRLLDNTREFIRSFELIETAITEEKIICPLTQVNLGFQDDQVITKGLKDRELGRNNKVGGAVKQAIGEASEVREKMGTVLNRIGFRKNDVPSKEPSFNDVKKIEETISGHRDVYEKQRSYSHPKELNYNDVRMIKEKTNCNHRVVYENQIDSIIQSIGNILGTTDEVFPSFLPKPIPKKDIPLNSLEVFQGLLKIMLLEDDTRLAREMRNQWDVINTLLGEYDISIVCFEDEEKAKDKMITKEEKIAWFEERLVNPNKFHDIKTSSPALIGSNDVILRGVVFVPRKPSE